MFFYFRFTKYIAILNLNQSKVIIIIYNYFIYIKLFLTKLLLFNIKYFKL